MIYPYPTVSPTSSRTGRYVFDIVSTRVNPDLPVGFAHMLPSESKSPARYSLLRTKSGSKRALRSNVKHLRVSERPTHTSKIMLAIREKDGVVPNGGVSAAGRVRTCDQRVNSFSPS